MTSSQAVLEVRRRAWISMTNARQERPGTGQGRMERAERKLENEEGGLRFESETSGETEGTVSPSMMVVGGGSIGCGVRESWGRGVM